VRRPTLRTQRLLLVPQTRSVAAALVSGADCGLPLGEGYPHADSLDAMRMLVEHGTDHAAGWFVTLAEDGRVIGDCGTVGWADDDGRVEIGYGLAAPSRGRGLGTEVVRALAEWVGDQPGVRAVTASVEVGNVASRRVLERLGFRLVETVDRHWQFERRVT
jgi:RimJ/RimL family protein N-acetyltransferase